MSQEHPITPPSELVKQWIKECDNPEEPGWQEYEQRIATRAARWGGDQELEACCEWLKGHKIGNDLRLHRRPKPPSLKEQALALINHDPENQPFLSEEGIATIRRALESLTEEQ